LIPNIPVSLQTTLVAEAQINTLMYRAGEIKRPTVSERKAEFRTKG
jgi:hypothetical protein